MSSIPFTLLLLLFNIVSSEWQAPKNPGFSDSKGEGSKENGAKWGQGVRLYLASGIIGDAVQYSKGRIVILDPSAPIRSFGNLYNWDDEFKYHEKMQQCTIPYESILEVAKGVTPGPLDAFLKKTLEGNATLYEAKDVATFLKRIRFENGSNPQYVAWTCRKESQACCGVDCCPYSGSLVPSLPSVDSGLLWKILVAVLLVVIVILLIIKLVFCMIRRNKRFEYRKISQFQV